MVNTKADAVGGEYHLSLSPVSNRADGGLYVVTVLKADAVIDGKGGPPVRDVAIVVDGAHIRDIVPTAQVNEDQGTHIVTLAGCTLLPGLVDTHTHLSMTPRLNDYGGRMRDPLPMLVLRATRNLRDDLLSGVTTVRCLGDKELLDISCAVAVKDGTVPGPDILPSGRGLRSTNGHGAAGTPTDGVDAVIQRVRDNLHAGAMVIKLFISGDPKEDNITDCCYSPAEIRAAVEEAKRAGCHVAGHCMGGPGLRYFVEAAGEMATVEHGGFLTKADMDLMHDTGAWLGLTCNSMFRVERLQNLRTPQLRQKVEAIRDQVLENYRSSLDAGLRFTLGTDAQHGEMAFELEFIVQELDVSPLRAIQAATLDNATAIGLGQDRGSLEIGKRADVIAVGGDPSADICDIRKVQLVMKEGQIQSGLSAA